MSNIFSGMLGAGNTTYLGGTSTSGLATSGLQQYYQTGAATAGVGTAYERERKIEVPIIDKTDRAGIFLRGEHGELIHIDSERLYKMAGIEW